MKKASETLRKLLPILALVTAVVTAVLDFSDAIERSKEDPKELEEGS